MPQRRSARLRAAARDSQSIPPAPKRQRRERPLANGGCARSPLHEVTNATTISTRAHRSIHTSNESRCVLKDGKTTEHAQKRASKRHLRTTPTPNVHQATIANPERVRTSETPSRRSRSQTLSVRKENELDGSSALRKEKDPDKSEAQVAESQASQTLEDERRTLANMKAKNSEEALPSLMRKSPSPPVGSSKLSLATRNRLKRTPRPPSPPLYPEDEIQPKPSPTSKQIEGKQHRKPIPRPPTPPVLYPEDEIQPLPPRKGKEQSGNKDYKQAPLPRSPPMRNQALRTTSAAALATLAPSHSRSSPPRSPSTQGAQVSRKASQKQTSREEPSDERTETPVTPHASQNIQPERVKDGPPDPSPASEPRRLSFSPEMPAPPRPPTASGLPAPLHTYSKRRHAVQDLALPSRKSLGVRSRASSGGSTGSASKSERGEAPLDEAESDVEDSEESESDEESGKVDSALRSFIGQQRKMWDEIDNIDLEEDFD